MSALNLLKVGRNVRFCQHVAIDFKGSCKYMLPYSSLLSNEPCMSHVASLRSMQIVTSGSDLLQSVHVWSSPSKLTFPSTQKSGIQWSAVRTYAKNKGKDKGGKSQKKVKLTSEQLEGVVDLERVTLELDKALEDLKEKFIHQVTVRTSQGVFNNLTVKTPDGSFPLIQLGQVAQKSPQLVVVNLAAVPQYIPHVKTAFEESGLNVNPQQDGTSLFVPIPKVTREHREGLVKSAKMLSEKCKKQLRDTYSKHAKKIKASKEGHSADDLKAADEMVKDLMHGKLKQVDEMTELKRQELMGGK